MFVFVIWFALLLLIIKTTRSWLRGILVSLYLFGSAVVVLWG